MLSQRELFVPAPEISGPSAMPPAAAAITRGTCRLLSEMGFVPLTEFKLANSRRADVAALDKRGEFILVEVKSSAADFRADRKWREYLPFCDRFYFAVGEDFPRPLLPADTGLIIADRFGATILRPAVAAPMNGNRRRHQILRFARKAAARLAASSDFR